METSVKAWKISRKKLFLVLSLTFNFHSRFYLTIRLWARDFYEVIVDEAEGQINYCFSIILTEINADNGFPIIVPCIVELYM